MTTTYLQGAKKILRAPPLVRSYRESRDCEAPDKLSASVRSLCQQRQVAKVAS